MSIVYPITVFFIILLVTAMRGIVLSSRLEELERKHQHTDDKLDKYETKSDATLSNKSIKDVLNRHELIIDELLNSIDKRVEATLVDFSGTFKYEVVDLTEREKRIRELKNEIKELS